MVRMAEHGKYRSIKNRSIKITAIISDQLIGRQSAGF